MALNVNEEKVMPIARVFKVEGVPHLRVGEYGTTTSVDNQEPKKLRTYADVVAELAYIESYLEDVKKYHNYLQATVRGWMQLEFPSVVQEKVGGA